MVWYHYAFLSAAVFPFLNFIDKYILSKELKDYNALPIFTSLTAFVVGSFIWTYSGFPFLGTYNSILILFTGVLTNFSLFFYFKALSVHETSKIIFLFRITPIIILVLSAVFLNEYITKNQFIGFLCILLVTFIFSKPKNLNKKSIQSSAFLPILLFDFMTACSAILIKYALNTNSFLNILSYESLGIGFGGIIIYVTYPSIRKSFHLSINTISNQGIILIFINELIFVIAKTLIFFAYSLGPTALVNIIASTEVIFGVIYGALLTLLFPKIFKEDLSRLGISNKIITAIVIIVGIFLTTR